ncbi:MAG: asparagine synthetase B family protein, partial [Candidatus Omnitrophota bacterium]
SWPPQPYRSRTGKTRLFLDGYLFFGNSETLSELQRNAENFFGEILSAYEQEGVAFVRKIRGGMFHLILLDEEAKQLVVVNDRLGLLPLYYVEAEGAFGFAPLAGPLAECARCTHQVDTAALSELLLYGWMVGERSAFKPVKLLAPGTVLTYSFATGVLRKETYDQIHHRRDEGEGSEKEWFGKIDELLTGSMRRYQGVPGNYALMLSGGLDSRLILEYFPRKERLRAYIFGSRDYDDARLAEAVARGARIPYRLFENGSPQFLSRSDSEFAATESYLVWHAGEAGERMCEDGCHICFDGIYGDGFLGGYYFQHFAIKNAISGLPLTPYRNLRKLAVRLDRTSRLFTDDMLQTLLRDKVFEQFRETEEERLLDIEAWLAPREQTLRYEEEGQELFKLCDMRRRVSNLQGMRLRSFLEVAYPFCDYALMDFVFSLPLRARANYKLYFSFLRSRRRWQTFHIPYDKTWIPADAAYPLQLGGIAWRNLCQSIEGKLCSLSAGKWFPRRRLYMDFDFWFRNDSAFRENVSQELRCSYFDPDKVRRFLEQWRKAKFHLGFRMAYLLSFARSCREAQTVRVFEDSLA